MTRTARNCHKLINFRILHHNQFVKFLNESCSSLSLLAVLRSIGNLGTKF